MHPIEDTDKCCERKSPPHWSAAKKAFAIVRDLVGKFDNRVDEPFLFRPLLTNDCIDTLHHKKAGQN